MKIQPNASLAEYTSWRVGGLADTICIPNNVEEVAHFLQQLPSNTPITWLGLGSNVLVRDGGLAGVVIITQGGLNKITQINTHVIRAEAGVACAQIARYSARLGLTGLEFMAGIPGTVGGALTMNAGCYGGETWQFVQQVEVIDRSGQRHIRAAKEYEVRYRHVKPVQDKEAEWFVAGYFELQPGDKTTSLRAIHDLLEKRNAAQPTGLPNCGSVFRNPPGDYAARLIEQCGLKGFRIGGAAVSEKHANFIINTGHASAADIESLIQHIQLTVEREKSIRLCPEVCIIGKPG